jgi:hypothetical protein
VHVTLTASPDPATVGRPLTYTATVANTRSEATKNVTLYFMMTSLPADPVSHAPAEPAFASAALEGAHCENPDGKTFICPLGSLPPGRSLTARFVVVPKTPTLYRAQFSAQVYTHVEGEAYSANAQAVRQVLVHA